MEDILKDRVETLQKISGLKVHCYKEKGQSVFSFYHKDTAVKTCFTYPKAKLFAEGVRFGMEINETPG